MNGDSIDFTAIRGVQAGAAYYVIMVPLKVISRLSHFADEGVPADLRAQRVLNKGRVPQIADYRLCCKGWLRAREGGG
jgi:DNA sulfur modification protein DndB